MQLLGAAELCAFPSSLLFIIQLSCKTRVRLSVNRSEDSPLGQAVRAALGSSTTLHQELPDWAWVPLMQQNQYTQERPPVGRLGGY